MSRYPDQRAWFPGPRLTLTLSLLVGLAYYCSSLGIFALLDGRWRYLSLSSVSVSGDEIIVIDVTQHRDEPAVLDAFVVSEREPPEDYGLRDGLACRIILWVVRTELDADHTYSTVETISIVNSTFYTPDQSGAWMIDEPEQNNAIAGADWVGHGAASATYFDVVDPVARRLGLRAVRRGPGMAATWERRTAGIHAEPFRRAFLAMMVTAVSLAMCGVLVALMRLAERVCFPTLPEEHCPCGYDLKGLPDGSACPECGTHPSSRSSTTVFRSAS